MKIMGFDFDGPFSLKIAKIPEKQGIYAIIARLKFRQEIKQKIIYIGESENLANRVNKNHEKYDCWLRNVTSEDDLFIAYHLTPHLSDDQRKFVEKILISFENPICNE